MNSISIPTLVIVGQIAVDDVVPARPGRWQRQLGGNALYAAAGARLVLPAGEIGVVSRRGSGLGAAVTEPLAAAGLQTALAEVDAPHLVEWLLYEPDGSRRSVPRGLRSGGEGGFDRAEYLARLTAISPAFEDIPNAWRRAAGFHLAPQVWTRHQRHVAGLAGAGGALITLDPSPHYAAGLSLEDFAARFTSDVIVLPSQQELAANVNQPACLTDWIALGERLIALGVGEFAIKLGAGGVLVADEARLRHLPACSAEVQDPTGAGDAFCGAYAAARVSGRSALAAAAVGAAAAAVIVETRGAEAALALDRDAVTQRLRTALEMLDPVLRARR